MMALVADRTAFARPTLSRTGTLEFIHSALIQGARQEQSRSPPMRSGLQAPGSSGGELQRHDC